MIDEKIFLINQLKMIKNIWKHSKNYNWSRRSLHNWLFSRLQLFHKRYKMIGIYLSKQQTLDADPKAIHQVNFTGNLSGNNIRLIFFIIEEV